MPRPSWKGFLRLSLASCPVYLTPATTRTKSVRLHQVWVPQTQEVQENEPSDERVLAPVADRATRERDIGNDEPDEVGPATRIALRPVNRNTGEAIEARKGHQRIRV